MMIVWTGTTLLGALFAATVGFGQPELMCNAYPVRPIVLTEGPGHFAMDDGGLMGYRAGEFQSSPDQFQDVLDLAEAGESASWFYHAAWRRWSAGLVPEKQIPGWLAVEELEPLVGPIDDPWLMYFGPKYLWFKTEGSMETGKGTAEFQLVFSLSSEETNATTLDILIWPQWLIINISDVSIETDFYTFPLEERPRCVLRLEFLSPDQAHASFSGSHGLFAVQSERTMTELKAYDSFRGMLAESFAWLAEKNEQEGWRYGWEFGIRKGRDPVRSWGRSPYNDLITDLLVTKPAWRGREDPEGLEAALAAIEAEYDMQPGELPPPIMRLISGEIPYFMRPPKR